MDAGIYFPLFLVLVSDQSFSIHYLSADLQPRSMFRERKPLSCTARRSGWQGFTYDLGQCGDSFVLLYEGHHRRQSA
jgi:type II restriction enzyme